MVWEGRDRDLNPGARLHRPIGYQTTSSRPHFTDSDHFLVASFIYVSLETLVLLSRRRIQSLFQAILWFLLALLSLLLWTRRCFVQILFSRLLCKFQCCLNVCGLEILWHSMDLLFCDIVLLLSDFISITPFFTEIFVDIGFVVLVNSSLIWLKFLRKYAELNAIMTLGVTRA